MLKSPLSVNFFIFLVILLDVPVHQDYQNEWINSLDIFYLLES